ncbi:L-threonylcarbamoyladenylate synthase [Humisphaera borealis]|uniref:Threonylcarbamoyl-AMP synthase n=1 Tax=Humisphaera borealis TaxID=2807512 RepID=A0A7M2X200_9BACT|nr:L-threonylcarbamoyladenylate synthase [Humisphaera borealis]QOV90770.1 threonylcarbamoyl-AMP synthase [Humisphaera borealis]
MIDQAVQHLRAGRLVAFPTETVYGLGADATNADAVRAIFAAKGRPATNPLIVHVADIETAQKFTTGWSDAAQTLAAAWWPGPLTIVLPKHPSIVDEATAGLQTVGLRVPDHPVALELLKAFGGAVAAPSANRSNHLSPTTAEHVRDDLGDRVNLVLDGGPCKVGIESTVLDLTGEVPTILRPGGVSRRQLEFILGTVREPDLVAAPAASQTSPGQMERHYAPLTPAVRFETAQRGLIHPQTDAQSNGIVVLSPLKIFKKWGPIVAMPNDPTEYAQHLYAVLHELDGMRLRTIYIEVPPEKPEWIAIRDRIRRATVPLD